MILVTESNKEVNMGDFNDCHSKAQSEIFVKTSTLLTSLSSGLSSFSNSSKPFECQICFKKFSSKQNKREHIRIEHTYSSSLKHAPLNSKRQTITDLLIPKLSTLVRNSADPHFRPFTKVQKFYLFSDLFKPSELSKIDETRRRILQLPPLNSIVN